MQIPKTKRNNFGVLNLIYSNFANALGIRGSIGQVRSYVTDIKIADFIEAILEHIGGLKLLIRFLEGS